MIYSETDILKDEYLTWVNVQEPIKQTFQSLSKAIRMQSRDICELNRILKETATKEGTIHLISETINKSKHVTSEQINNVDIKINNNTLLIHSNNNKAQDQFNSINKILEEQAMLIKDLTYKLDQRDKEIELLKSPNNEIIFNYVDRQIQNIGNEIDKKIINKADYKDILKAVPERCEDMIRVMSGQYKDLKSEVNRLVSRDEFENIVIDKADKKDLTNAILSIGDMVSQHDLQACVNSQVKPLVHAMTSLEKTVQIQESLNRQDQRQNKSVSMISSQDMEKIRSLIDKVITERRMDLSSGLDNDKVSSLNLEISLSQHTERMLREVSGATEAMRMEIMASCREETGSLRRKVEAALINVVSSARESNEVAKKTRAAMRDLSSNVAKAISKKADRNEIKKEIVKNITIDNNEDCLPISSTIAAPFVVRQSKGFDALLEETNSRNSVNTNSKKVASQSNDKNIDSNESTSLRRDMNTMVLEIDKLRKDIKGTKDSLSNSISIVKTAVDGKANTKELREAAIAAFDSQANAASSVADWRLALGDLSMNIRRELAEKTGREEMYSIVRSEMDEVRSQVTKIEKGLDVKASEDELSKLSNEMTSLRTRVSSELTGARWLWTSGQLVKDGWVPWDAQVVNAAPAVLVWKKGATTINVRLPGLYRVCVSIFTGIPVVMQLCLNGEPIISCQPDGKATESGSNTSSFVNTQTLHDERYIQRRLRHSAGEVTCISIDEHLSLPAEAELSLRFHSTAPAQAFMMIKKL